MSKLNLDELKVQSFVTSFDTERSETIKGGGLSDGPGVRCRSYNPFCGGGNNNTNRQGPCGTQTWPGHPAKCLPC